MELTDCEKKILFGCLKKCLTVTAVVPVKDAVTTSVQIDASVTVKNVVPVPVQAAPKKADKVVVIDWRNILLKEVETIRAKSEAKKRKSKDGEKTVKKRAKICQLPSGDAMIPRIVYCGKSNRTTILGKQVLSHEGKMEKDMLESMGWGNAVLEVTHVLEKDEEVEEILKTMVWSPAKPVKED